MIYPVTPTFPITQKFGEHPDWYPLTKGHNGLDFGLPEGSPTWSTFAGLVTFAGVDPETEANPKAGYGLCVRIQGVRFLAIYGHLTLITVKRDEQVANGHIIGRTGGVTAPTGFSTGAHLHFELRTASSLATCIDPLPLLNPDEKANRTPIFYAQIRPEVSGVNVRTGPRIDAPLAGKVLKPNEVIAVYSLAGPSVWVEHDRGFSAFNYEPLMKVKES